MTGLGQLTTKSRFDKVFLIVLHQARTCDTPDVQRDIRVEFRGKFILEEDITDSDTPPWIEQTKHLAEDELFLLLWNKVEHTITDVAVRWSGEYP